MDIQTTLGNHKEELDGLLKELSDDILLSLVKSDRGREILLEDWSNLIRQDPLAKMDEMGEPTDEIWECFRTWINGKKFQSREKGLVSIKSLADADPKLHFYIPAYQRGYRWKEQQVEEFLEDIGTVKHSEKEWNCIQPLVVKFRMWHNQDEKIVSGFEVIDGQQRLTTIFIILQFLINGGKCSEATKEEYPSVFEGAGYTLEYKTRQNSEEFLKKISSKTEQDARANIDFYRMKRAYDTVDNYFSGKDENKKKFFVKNLLDHTKFIWYEPLEAPEELFTRLNKGRIPLSDAELIKAMLLNKSNFIKVNANNEFVRRRQIEIATEWDAMENSLHDDKFWCFLFDPDDPDDAPDDDAPDESDDEKKYSGLRLDAIFELWARARNYEDRGNQHFVYNAVREYIGRSSAEKYWDEIRELYGALRTWYDDPKIYHYLGYLLLKDVREKRGKKTAIEELKDQVQKWVPHFLHGEDALGNVQYKTEFIHHLIENIGKKIRDGSVNGKLKLKDVRYGNRNTRRILILHNVLIYLLRFENKEGKYGEGIRFPFNYFKKENWQVEHIASRGGDDLDGPNDQKEWLISIYLTLFADGDTKVHNLGNGDNLDFTKLSGKVSEFLSKYQERRETNDNSQVSEGWRDRFSSDAGQRRFLKDVMTNFLVGEEGNSLSFDDVRKVVVTMCPWVNASDEWRQDENIHSLRNLALLDSRTNQQYKNVIFPLKRKWILCKERGEPIKYLTSDEQARKQRRLEFKEIPGKKDVSTYILPCTRDAFTKSHTLLATDMLSWQPEDGKQYYEAMKSIFEHSDFKKFIDKD